MLRVRLWLTRSIVRYSQGDWTRPRSAIMLSSRIDLRGAAGILPAGLESARRVRAVGIVECHVDDCRVDD